VTALALIAVLLAACSPSASPTAPAGALRVVATTTVFADIAANVGGDRVEVSSIIPSGVGPEDYEPQPDDARRVAEAQLVISNGVGLDDWLADLLQGGGDIPQLVLGEGITPIVVEDEPNPHFWLDPTLVRDHYVTAIASKLSELDPAGAETYGANADAYADQLDALDAELLARVEEIPAANRKLVTFHDAFPYFARHFGFEQIGVILENVGQEPSAAELAALVQTVREAQVKAVFSEAQFNPRLAQTLADEAGVTSVVTTLYNDALGPAPADSYLGMMRWNMDQIVAALK
jgi:zinc/manganese transport system substrate-binding protein/manganese/iron transport system substrate-binding protein